VLQASININTEYLHFKWHYSVVDVKPVLGEVEAGERPESDILLPREVVLERRCKYASSPNSCIPEQCERSIPRSKLKDLQTSGYKYHLNEELLTTI
jgi:hypothetical protein